MLICTSLGHNKLENNSFNPRTNFALHDVISVDHSTAFNNITNNDNEYHDLFANWKYFTIDEINQTLSKVKLRQRNLFVMHFNVQSLQKEFCKSSLYVSPLSTKPDVIWQSRLK